VIWGVFCDWLVILVELVELRVMLSRLVEWCSSLLSFLVL